jgi:hypothetical protein
MHIYPILLLTAKSRKEAIGVASRWVGEVEGRGCPYDYGDVVARESGRKMAMQGGTRRFRQEVEMAIRTERRVLKEHWDVSRQFLSAFPEPPPKGARFDAAYDLGLGLNRAVKAGKRIKESCSVDTGYDHVRRLAEIRRHMEYRDQAVSSDAMLYDIRKDREVPPAEAGKDCWIVMLDFHC